MAHEGTRPVGLGTVPSGRVLVSEMLLRFAGDTREAVVLVTSGDTLGPFLASAKTAAASSEGPSPRLLTAHLPALQAAPPGPRRRPASQSGCGPGPASNNGGILGKAAFSLATVFWPHCRDFLPSAVWEDGKKAPWGSQARAGGPEDPFQAGQASTLSGRAVLCPRGWEQGRARELRRKLRPREGK